MIPFLILGHAGLAVLLLVAGVTGRERILAIRVCGALGIVFALGLALGPEDGEVWRTITIAGPATTLVGLAGAVAWLLVLVNERGAGRWDLAAAVGIATSALALVALTHWIVPALLVLLVITTTLALVVRTEVRRVEVWTQLFGSGALIALGLFGIYLESDVWALPATIEGWPRWVLLAGVVLRMGAVPHLGMWRLRGSATALLPLAVASGALFLARPELEQEPWAAAGALLVALALTAATERWTPAGSVTGTWVVLMALAAAFSLPAVAYSAAIAACLGVAADACRRGPWGELGAAVAWFAPLTLGFAVLLAGAVEAFEQASTAETATLSAPWTVVTALLPLALAAGVLLARLPARSAAVSRWGPIGLFGTSFFLALQPEERAGLPDGATASGDASVLLFVAALAGAAAWLVADRLTRATAEPLPTSYEPATMPFVAEPLVTKPQESRLPWLGRTAAAAGAVAQVAITIWVTVEGLRVGFL